jgi:hypothetical protein
MTKNGQKIRFQCNQSLAWAKGAFWGCGYKSYTKILNFPQWILLLDFYPISVLLFSKVFTFLCNFCNFGLYPNAVLGYIGIEVSVTFVTERALAQS